MKNKFTATATLELDEVRTVDSRKSRRESVPPKIVVCPPMEELKTTAPRASRLLRALGRRMPRSDGSSSSSDSSSTQRSGSSDSDSEDSRRRPRSTVSLRRVFQRLSLGARASSCSPAERAPKKQPQPKRILRPPVSYTYVRGLSGLPTQRVPRHALYR